MSDGEVEVEQVQGFSVLPKDVVQEIGSTKLFNKWSYEDVEIRDISLTYVHPPTECTCPWRYMNALEMECGGCGT